MTTNHMEQAHGLAESYEDALAAFRTSLEDARRHWVAYMVTQYPHRDALQVIADAARNTVGARAVEINAIYDGHQVTLASSPDGLSGNCEQADSLCVLTVGAGRPLAVDDIAHDPFTEHHAARHRWGAWASVPLIVNGSAAGTICALESTGRSWTEADQSALNHMAGQLSAEIECWIHSQETQEDA